MIDHPKLSVAVITFNESARLSCCVESVRFADEVVVVDSGSSDNTPIVAQNLGCRVLHRAFTGFGDQKQYAVDNCSNPWVLILDSDELISPTHGKIVLDAIRSPRPGVTAFRLQRKNFMHGRWIRRCGWWPDPLIRLVRQGNGSFSEDPVHERWLPHGDIEDLPCVIEHHSFRDYAEMLLKLQRYSSLGAARLVAEKKKVHFGSPIFHGLWTFLQTYVIKLGVLDGFDGFMISMLNAGGSFMKYAKALEAVKYPEKSMREQR